MVWQLVPRSRSVLLIPLFCLHEALQRRIAAGVPITNTEIHAAAVEGAVHRLRPKLMTVTAVLASLAPILAQRDIGSDVMPPIAGGMTTSTIHVLILVPVFFVLLKERAPRRGTLNLIELKKL